MSGEVKNPITMEDRFVRRLLAFGLLTALIFPACNKSESGNETPAQSGDASAIQTIVTSEEQILALTPGLASLGKGLLNLQLPDAPRRELFAPTLDVVDLEDSGEADWQPSSDKKSMAADSGQLWASFVKEVAFFEHAKFAIVKGNSSLAIRNGSLLVSISQPWHA